MRIPRRLLAALAALALASPALAGELSIRVADEAGELVWARVEVRGDDGKSHQPPFAFRDRTARVRPGIEGWYLGSFLVEGEAKLEVPAGAYTVIAERGTEFERVEQRVEVAAAEPQRVILSPKRWIDMNAMGWWSGDFHVHRSLEDTPALLQAEGLNLGVVFTMWNKRNLWEDQQYPQNPVREAAPRQVMTITNGEDERGGGAWMFHQLRRPLPLGVEGRWFPSGLEFIKQAVAQRYYPEGFPWIDCEKLFWWETPVVMALQPCDSLGLLHNHFTQYGIHSAEAWGRPRDHKKYPFAKGFVEHSLDLYYRYVNLGFRRPATAGSASGVLPNPAGYNRIYVRLNEPFSVEAFYRNLRHGKSFVTNGPMLFFDAADAPGRQVRVVVEVRSREPLDRVEIIGNGEVVETFEAPAGEKTFQTELLMPGGRYSWLAARCFTKNDATIRLAHSQPVHLDGVWDSSADAAYFVRWIDELIAETEADSARFENENEREKVLEIYRQAREFYAARR